MEINGELDGVYDFEITSPVADTGEFVYFFPILQFIVEEETNRLANVLRRFGYYDVELEEYAVLPIEEQVLPRFGVSYVVAGVDEMDEGFSVQLLVGMPEVDTGVFAPDSTVYLPPAGEGAERLVEVMSGYQDGEAFKIGFSYKE